MKRLALVLTMLGLLFIGAASATAEDRSPLVNTADLNAATAPISVTPVDRYVYRGHPGRHGGYYRYPPYVYHPRYYGYYPPRDYYYGPRRYYGYYGEPDGFYYQFRGPRVSFGFGF